MKVIIIGAGIAGLSLAISLAQSNHHVLMLESAPQLAEIGAGIQMTPQAVKYFFKWGLKEDIMAQCIIPQKMFIRDSKDGRVLGVLNIADWERQYGAPYIVVHRAVLHSILHKHAVRAGAEIMLDSKVVKYDFDNGAVDLYNGKRLEADLVVAADGINSFARSQLLGSLDPGTEPTGWAAFRMMAEVSKIKANPETAELVNLESHHSNFWIAPKVSCMTYLVKDATVLNIVLSHRDDIDTSNFTPAQCKAVVDNLFKDFDSPVRRLLDICLPKIANYPVYAVPPLPHWAHVSGRFTLAGDAAHAMAFYLSMGVSLAVEDAVALATLLDVACPTSAESVNADKLRVALQAFETVRKERCQAMQRASLETGDTVHVAEGDERKLLYEMLGKAWGNGSLEPGVIPASSRFEGGMYDKNTRDWCYGYDAIGSVVKCYEEKLADIKSSKTSRI